MSNEESKREAKGLHDVLCQEHDYEGFLDEKKGCKIRENEEPEKLRSTRNLKLVSTVGFHNLRDQVIISLKITIFY